MGALVGRIARIVLFIFIMLVLAVSLLAAWTMWRVRASLPELEGRVEVEGLGGPVVIARDEHGVPHVFGATEADVFFGLGYAHAQDRLFQMDLVRRSVEGRLSEIVPAFIGGEALVRADARNRILGRHLNAQAIADNLEGPAAAAVDAYVAGVNALLESDGFTPPPEYTLLGIAPEPWDAADSAAVWTYMAADLTTGLGTEYERLVLADQLSADQLAEFTAPFPDFGERSLDLADLWRANPALARPGPEAHEEVVDEEPAIPQGYGVETGPTPGSNNWVVSGAHSRSGAPLLANDPHLGLGAPNIFYLARLALPDGDVAGATIPGAPFVVLGRNERAAWGFTNGAWDVADYQIRPEGAVVARSREETIKVRFGADVSFIALDAAEGPILDDAYFNLAPFGDADVVLQTTEDDPDNAAAEAVYALMKAQSWEDFVEAGRGFVAPMQNMIYADVDGTIGYALPGRAPIRGAGGAWVDEIPFDDLPRVRDPASGVIATANNLVTPDRYPYPVSGEFAVYRIARIHERLAETELHDVASFQDIQRDVTSPLALRLLPSAARGRPSTEAGATLQAMLADWDGALRPSEPAALAYAAWYEALHRGIYADELGDLFPRFNGARGVFIDRVLSGEWSDWCDDVTTEDVDETCPLVIGRAFDAAAARIAALYGEDPAGWSWGEAHAAVFAHPLLSAIGPLERIATVRAVHGGDGNTVNVGHFYFAGADYRTVHAATFRAVYDLADLDASQFVQGPGQSGHPLSPHYRDLAAMWSSGDSIPIDTSWELRSPPPGMRLLELAPAAE